VNPGNYCPKGKGLVLFHPEQKNQKERDG